MKDTEKLSADSRSTGGRRALATMVVGAVFGALVWALSPALTGHEEPWDAPWPYYWVAMSLGGFILGLISPRHFWAPVVGIYVGQVAFGAVALNPIGPIIMPLFISAGIFGVPPALVGSGIAVGIVVLLRTFNRSSDT